jgi:acyl carrier protein
MVKDKQLKNLKNNKGEMKSNTISRSIRMRNFNQDLASNFATNIMIFKTIVNNALIFGIRNKVKYIVVEQFGVDISAVTEDSKLKTGFGEKDSLEMVELLQALEGEFGIEIPDEDAETLENASVGQVINYIVLKTLNIKL